jgi:hypothetical protein
VESTFCKLTLVVPSDAQDRIIELMLASDPPVNGFTMWQADGHGESFKTANLGERVRGRVERSVFIAVIGLSRAKSLVDEIGRKAPIPHMAYWIEPVIEFGRTAAATPQDELAGVAP